MTHWYSLGNIQGISNAILIRSGPLEYDTVSEITQYASVVTQRWTISDGLHRPFPCFHTWFAYTVHT